MAKAKKSKQRKKNTIDTFSDNKFAMILIGLVIGVAGYFLIITPLVNYLDKQRFVNAQEALENNYRSAVNQLNIEHSYTVNELYCTYPDNDESSNPTCHVELYQNEFQDSVFLEEAWEAMNDVEISDVNYKPDNYQSDSAQQKLKNIENLECFIEYEINNEDLSLKALEMLCSGEARSEHFSVN